MPTEKPDSMGDRLDSVLDEIDALRDECYQIVTGKMGVPRMYSHTLNLKLIDIIKEQHNLIVLLDNRISKLGEK